MTELRAGRPVQITHRSKRICRRGATYELRSWDAEREVAGPPVRVTVLHAHRKPGTKHVWLLDCLIDRQEPLRFLARSANGDEDESGNRDYSERHADPLDAGAALSPAEQKVVTQESWRRQSERLRRERNRRESLSQEQRLALVKAEAAQRGVDLQSHERRLERQILNMERFLERQVAVA